MSGSPPLRNLLICFDAFGTLFVPRPAVHQQYAQVARALGLTEVTEERVKSSFRDAFRAESKRHPNYGRAMGMNAEQWWSNIITDTFKPLLTRSQSLPETLVPTLIARFNSSEGYALFEDVPPLMARLAQLKANPMQATGILGSSDTAFSHSRSQLPRGRVVAGVITNSDDRVPAVLTSLGLQVRALRYNAELKESLPVHWRQDQHHAGSEKYDIDFAVMSFDVGVEKPDAGIFRAAEELVFSGAGEAHGIDSNASEWTKVYVGDDFDKDVVGALDADWHAVWINREGRSEGEKLTPSVRWLADEPAGDLFELFERSPGAVGFSNLEQLARWLPNPQYS